MSRVPSASWFLLWDLNKMQTEGQEMSVTLCLTQLFDFTKTSHLTYPQFELWCRCLQGWPYLTNPAPKGSCPSCSNDFWERRFVKDPQPPFQWFMTYVIHSPQLFHYWQMVFLALPSVKENTVFANSSFLTLIQTFLSCQGIAWLLATQTCTSYGKIGNKKLEDTRVSHRIQW